MKRLNIKHIFILMLAFFALTITDVQAQKGKKGKKTEKQKKEKKEKTVKPASSKATSTSAATVQLSGMTRDDKNTLNRCPLHNKHMSLSDNYKADASDYIAAEGYPFAYQLNYRRYCNPCTRIMSRDKEAVQAANEAKKSKDKTTKAVADKCELHNKKLKTNAAYDPVLAEPNPNNAEMPHARQYSLSKYCKVCTKVYKIQAKVMK